MPMGQMYRAPQPTGARRGLNYKQVKQVQKIIQKNQQLKVFRTQLAVTGVTAGTLVELSAISEGDNFNNRDGDKIKVQSLKMPFAIEGDTASTILQRVRILVVRSKTGPLVAANFPASLTGQPDLDKMQVYYDRMYSYMDQQESISDNVTVPMYKSFKNKKVPHLLCHYDDDVSATDCQQNPIYLWIVGLSNTTPVSIVGYADLKFFNAN